MLIMVVHGRPRDAVLKDKAELMNGLDTSRIIISFHI
jgi:hypothetical protein